MATGKGKQAPNKDWRGSLRIARSESSFQQTLERMQLALKTNKFGKNQRTARANKVLAAILDRENAMKVAGVVPLSNYEMLKNIFMEDLNEVTASQIGAETAKEIARFMSRAQSVITKEQKDLIIAYYEAKSGTLTDEIENLRRFLTVKGLLKGKDAAKLPTDKEIVKSFEVANAENEAQKEQQAKEATKVPETIAA